MKTLFYIVQKCSKYFLALFLFVIFFSHQAKADCFVDGVQFDTTSTDNSNPITLDEIKDWKWINHRMVEQGYTEGGDYGRF